MDWGEFLFSINGRASRSDFWLFVGVSVAYGLSLLFIIYLAGEFVTYASSPLASFMASAPLLWPTIAVGIRRLHDRNKNDDWIFLFVGLPLVQNTIELIFKLAGWRMGFLTWPFFALQVVTLFATIWFFVELGFFAER